jgi:hypothetical protein
VSAVVLTATPAGACGGLIGRNGAVNLERTTTLAAYHDGVEHYVTSFTFAGGEGEFGSIIPLPGVPTNVEKGGSWTLQRLEREVRPVEPRAAFAAKAGGGAAVADAEVLLQTRIDALDVTVLRGGGAAVGQWATEHGFFLPPDAPEVLDFYASRSPIFLAARFDANAARQRGAVNGDGTPVHVTIPTDNPWVPLRILGLGKPAEEPITADVFLLNDHRPALLPAPDAPVGPGSALHIDRSEPASARLLADLRSDQGMAWMPDTMHFTFLRIAGPAGSLKHDLAIDVSGRDDPSARLAGLSFKPAAFIPPVTPPRDTKHDAGPGVVTWVVALGAVAFVAVAVRARRARRA